MQSLRLPLLVQNCAIRPPVHNSLRSFKISRSILPTSQLLSLLSRTQEEMASQGQTQEALQHNDVGLHQEEGEGEGEGEGEEEDELEKLEAEVNEMAQKILNYRTTLPGQLKSALSSILAAQRPVLPTHFDSGPESQPGPTHDPNPDVVRPIGSGNEALLTGESQETEKIRLLKQKISNNASMMLVVLKRMKDCMARIDNLDSCNGIIIHPAFKRKRSS